MLGVVWYSNDDQLVELSLAAQVIIIPLRRLIARAMSKYMTESEAGPRTSLKVT